MHFSQANALQAKGQLEEAVHGYRSGLAIQPESPEMLCNLGNALDNLGRNEEAIDAYLHAIAIRPEMVEAYNNLALALEVRGSHDEAIESYRKALSLRRNYAPAYFNLGRLLQLQGEFAEAAENYRQVIALQPNNAQACSNLGGALASLGELEEAANAYRRAIGIDPNLVAAQNGLNSLLGRMVPLWHVPMMNDTARNEAYFAALRAAVKPDSRVFEIGTGSGLLSMMAASLGAADVTTCEAEPVIAEAAKRIITQNGFEHQIRQVAKKSTDIELGNDLPQRADILVSEIFSSELLGERVLSSIEDTKRRLLTSDCRIIPAAASIMIALFGGEDIGSNLRVGNVCGFDLSGFNDIVPLKQTIARNDLTIEMLSDDINAFRFDFERESAWGPESKTLRIPVRTPGRCLGIIQWMHLEMDRDTTFENHPTVKAPASSWTRCAYLLPLPVDVRPGQVAVVSAVHDRTFPWFRLERFE